MPSVLILSSILGLLQAGPAIIDSDTQSKALREHLLCTSTVLAGGQFAIKPYIWCAANHMRETTLEFLSFPGEVEPSSSGHANVEVVQPGAPVLAAVDHFVYLDLDKQPQPLTEQQASRFTCAPEHELSGHHGHLDRRGARGGGRAKMSSAVQYPVPCCLGTSEAWCLRDLSCRSAKLLPASACEQTLL